MCEVKLMEVQVMEMFQEKKKKKILLRGEILKDILSKIIESPGYGFTRWLHKIRTLQSTLTT